MKQFDYAAYVGKLREWENMTLNGLDWSRLFDEADWFGFDSLREEVSAALDAFIISGDTENAKAEYAMLSSTLHDLIGQKYGRATQIEAHAPAFLSI